VPGEQDLGHCLPTVVAGLTGRVFISQERRLPVSFAVASARLGSLPHGGWFRAASETVYQGGMEYLMRVGPAGAVPGVSRLVRVRFTEPVYRDGAMTIGLRWEATGVTGGLFPVLDADIRLSADDGEDDCAGEDAGVLVTLTGSYRPPLGAPGAALDWLLLRTVAVATLRTLLARVAAALEGAPAGEQITASWLQELGPEAASG
jgi:hypothetical protein